MKPLLLYLPLLLLTCRSADTESSADLTIASSDYVVLAQKALTYQADFDLEAWADMLADDVVFSPPDGVPLHQGKAAVLANWVRWRQTNAIRSLRLSRFTHLPIQTRQQLPLMGKAGVYVVSYCLTDLSLMNGQSCQRSLHMCCHFDAQKRIDYYSLYFPPGCLQTNFHSQSNKTSTPHMKALFAALRRICYWV